jgi:hypothetical protein
VHKTHLEGRVLNPGSTVVTQLREDEASQRGWLLYDTAGRKFELVPVESRRFVYRKITFANALPDDIRRRVEEESKAITAQEGQAVLQKLVLSGTLAAGFGSADLKLPHLGENVFVDNSINSESLRERISQIKLSREKRKSAKELGLAMLRRKLEGTAYSLGDPELVFEQLLEGKMLEEIEKKMNAKPG